MQSFQEWRQEQTIKEHAFKQKRLAHDGPADAPFKCPQGAYTFGNTEYSYIDNVDFAHIMHSQFIDGHCKM